MKFLYGPTNEGIFVGVKDSLSIEQVKEIFFQTESWFIDLDDCLAVSPAKEIAMRAIGTTHFDPRYIDWCFNTALDLMLKGDKAESQTWLNYVRQFLGEGNDTLLKNFVGWFVNKSLYPGVEDLMKLTDKRKMLVTRNVPVIAEAYAQNLGLEFVANAWNKKEVVARKINGGLDRVSVMGNSAEDVEMLEALPIGSRALFYVLKSPKSSLLELSDPVIYTSRDRRGLVEILSK